MRKAFLSGIAALAAFQLAAEVGVPAENWQIAKDAVNPSVTGGVFTATSSGSDTIFGISNFTPFPAAENNLLVLSMRFPKGKKTMFQMFWATREQPNYSEANSVRLAIAGTGEMETYCINLAGQKGWGGTVTNLRVDPVALPKNAPETFAVGGFRIIDATAGMPVPARNWNGAANCKITGSGNGVLSGEFIGKNDPYVVASLPGKVDAAKLKTVEFELKVPEGCSPSGQLFWLAEGRKQFSEPCSARYKIAADGDFHKIVIDLSKSVEWKDSIIALRLDLVDRPAQSGEFQIRNVMVK